MPDAPLESWMSPAPVAASGEEVLDVPELPEVAESDPDDGADGDDCAGISGNGCGGGCNCASAILTEKPSEIVNILYTVFMAEISGTICRGIHVRGNAAVISGRQQHGHHLAHMQHSCLKQIPYTLRVPQTQRPNAPRHFPGSSDRWKLLHASEVISDITQELIASLQGV